MYNMYIVPLNIISHCLVNKDLIYDKYTVHGTPSLVSLQLLCLPLRHLKPTLSISLWEILGRRGDRTIPAILNKHSTAGSVELAFTNALATINVILVALDPRKSSLLTRLPVAACCGATFIKQYRSSSSSFVTAADADYWVFVTSYGIWLLRLSTIKSSCKVVNYCE